MLAFGAHPDDVEILCGGTLCLCAAKGQSTAVIDLTQGEMGSQGTPELRAKEAAEASRIMGLTHRENLRLSDGSLNVNDHSQLKSIVEVLRKYRPELVLAPFELDRHPDHRAASELISNAVFFAGASKFYPEFGPTHKPRQLLYYPFRTDPFNTHSGNYLFVDISSVYSQKLKAMDCYQSQFIRQLDKSTVETLINSELSRSSICARDEYFGAAIGVKHAEVFISKNYIGLADPLEFFRHNPGRNSLFFAA